MADLRSLYSQSRRRIAATAKNTKFSGEKPSTMLYLGVGMIALFKDLLDLAGIGSLPGIGTIVTFCFTALIWLLLTVFDKSGAKGNAKMVRSLIIMLIALIEGIGFGINFLPIETGTVILLFILAKREWSKEKKKWSASEKERQKKEGQLNARQIAMERTQEEAERRMNESVMTNNPVSLQDEPLSENRSAVMRDMKSISYTASAPTLASVQGNVYTEAEVRARYEQPRRNFRAGSYKTEKKHERQKYNDRKASFMEGQSANEENYKQIASARIQKIDQDIVRIKESDRIIGVDLEIQEKENEKMDIQRNLESDLARVKQRTDNYLSNLGSYSNADILSRLHKENVASKQSIKGTVDGLNSGMFDIARLAKENNAVMVHSIPSPGWSMKNTTMNNKEIETDKLSSAEKGRLLNEKQPDVSASIISSGDRIKGQNMFYPFGFIVDGKLIASYEEDAGAIAEGDSRRRKEGDQSTLQLNASDEFAKLSKAGSSGGYNESIVHKPVIKGILIDEERLQKADDYGKDLLGQARGFAKEYYPNQPVYIQKDDGIYTEEGKKVTAEEIYSNNPLKKST